MEAIRIEGLHKHFGHVRALDGLDLSVESGLVYGFLGPNGAGKTTTLRILAGLARPSAGRAFVAGIEVGKGDIRRKVGYLPEVPAFYGWMTPREFLADLVAPLYGLAPAEGRARAEELLRLVGLEEVAGRRIGGFSRGMRQRLGLAQALLHRPEVLLLDEPVSALDPAGRHEMLEQIASLRGQATVFMSSHILADVERICDAVAIIDRGRLVVAAGREELLSRYARPVLEVEFDASTEEVERWARTLADNPLVAGAQAAGRVVHLAAGPVERARAELPALVASSGLIVQRYEWSRPTLEDVFLQLVKE
ncbi:MAG: ATP-binding cassette domain-containing protein [Chloroflexia bacterium]